MSYLKKILSVIFFPVVFIAGSFCIQYVFVAIYNSSHILKLREMYPDLNDIEIIKTLEYKIGLSNFLNNNALLISSIIFVVFVFMFIRVLKKINIKKEYVSAHNLFLIFVLGLFISIFFNTFIYILNGVVHITDAYKINNIPFIVTIVTSGLLGPILEELLFRGIVYNKLLTFNNHKKACIITSIMFSLVHMPNIITMLYTFSLSFIMIYLYDRFKNLLAPIIFHIGINTTMNILIYILVKDSILINSFLLLIGLFGIVATIKLINSNSDNL